MAVHLPPCLTGETEVWGRCVPNQFIPVVTEALTQVVAGLTNLLGSLPAQAQTFVQRVIDMINGWLHPAAIV